jgi:hypothetical protein
LPAALRAYPSSSRFICRQHRRTGYFGNTESKAAVPTADANNTTTPMLVSERLLFEPFRERGPGPALLRTTTRCKMRCHNQTGPLPFFPGIFLEWGYATGKFTRETI